MFRAQHNGTLLARKLVRTMATSSASNSIVHSDLAYRALLRNLGLLSGMRHGKTYFHAALTGMNASEIARRMRSLENSVEFTLSGNDTEADFGS